MPRLSKIPREGGRKSSRTISSHDEDLQHAITRKLQQEIKDEWGKLSSQSRVLIKIPNDREDASVFNKKQIEFFKKHDRNRFKSLDFTFCDDDFIRELFPNRKSVTSVSIIEDIPYTVKISFSDIVRFRELSCDARIQVQRDADIKLSKLTTEFKKVHPKTSCMMLSKQIFLSTMDKCDESKMNDFIKGYDALLRVGIRNKAEAVGHNMMSEDGFLKDSNGDPIILIKHITNGKIQNDLVFSGINCSHIQTKNDIICGSCASIAKRLRQRCNERAQFLNKPLSKNTSVYHIVSTPSKVHEYAKNNAKQRKKDYDKNRFLASQNKRLREYGVDVAMGSSGEIINADIFKKGKAFLDEKRDTIPQSELIEALWKMSYSNFLTAKKSGKKAVRFDPVFIKFAAYLKSRMDVGSYDFCAKVFHLPSSRTLSNSDTLDGNAKDGLLPDTLRQMGYELENRLSKLKDLDPKHEDFLRSCILKFDEIKVKEKICFNPHTMEIVGFVDGAVNEDVITREFEEIANDKITEEEISSTFADTSDTPLPDTADHLLLFMVSTWDREQPVIKRSVARFTVKAKSDGETIAKRIKLVIHSLYNSGFIVNQVASDGASENVSAMKHIADLKAKDVFPDLDSDLPQDVLVAFKHPSDDKRYVFIGGEMPHWIKRCVNALENSSKFGHKRSLQFRGQPVSLDMIRKAWEGVEHRNVGVMRQTKLTTDHFEKNAHSRMRVFLAMQVLSQSVYDLIQYFVDGNERLKETFSSLSLLISKLNRLVDIWNHPPDKGMECIDSPDHEYIRELEDVLRFFTEWKNESETTGDPLTFFPIGVYNDLCWLVYGLKGVAFYNLDYNRKWKMIQRRGGTDDVEHTFSSLRNKNSNPTIMDCSRSLGRESGVRSSTFSVRPKGNTRGDSAMGVSELIQKPFNKRKIYVIKHDPTNKRRRNTTPPSTPPTSSTPAPTRSTSPTGSISTTTSPIECNFKVLHSPNISLLVSSLHKHKDVVGNADIIELLSPNGKDSLNSVRFWTPLVTHMANCVQSCLASKKTELKAKKKKLALMEMDVVQKFAKENARSICSSSHNAKKSTALLYVIASAFLSMLLFDMCQGYTEGTRSVNGIITKAFNMNNEEIKTYFDSGCVKKSKSLHHCIYYVGGWHAHALKKASIRREPDLRKLMQTVFANITMKRIDAKDQNLPIQKVERVEKLGGLKYISDDYFIFIQRMEYVFMNLLTPEKLAMIGSDLITNVYTELSNNNFVSAAIMQFTTGVDNVHSDLLTKLTLHMTRTYCRMRGKDFARKMMQTGFREKNLGKGIRPTVAIISDPKLRLLAKNKQKKTKTNTNVEEHIEDEFTSLGYRELQKLCKEKKLKATGNIAALLTCLRNHKSTYTVAVAESINSNNSEARDDTAIDQELCDMFDFECDEIDLDEYLNDNINILGEA